MADAPVARGGEAADAGAGAAADAASDWPRAAPTDVPSDSVAREIERRLASDEPLPSSPAGRGAASALTSRRVDTLRAFYRDRGHRPLWLDADRGALLRALRSARGDGLPVDHYLPSSVDADGPAARPGETGAEAGRIAFDLARRDLRLSAGFLRLASDLARGTIDPSDQGLTWRIERGDRPGRAPLEAVAGGEDPGAVLDRLRPDTPQYDRLREALERYRAVARDGGWEPVPTGEPGEAGGAGSDAPVPDREPLVLEVGDRSRLVPALRRRLAAEPGAAEAAPERGVAALDRPDVAPGRPAVRDTLAPRYDSALSRRVRAFQRRHGLAVDGIVGPETLAELNRPVEDRLVEIVLNLDRQRWLPSELGARYVMVNVAGFEMEVVEADTTAMAMDVVVGEPAWKTPIFSDTLSHLVVNPYWNVPRSISEEDILPAAREDPSYISRNRFQVVERFGPDAEPIPRDSIDWRSVDPGDFPHLLRQRPGPGNSLGRIKFLFPNRFDVYLHDTPADRLFEQWSRAFSHGCIRVEHPFRLGRYLVRKGAKARPGELEELVESGERVWVDLTTEVPVYVIYLTAWSGPGGAVHFHDDIYERDDEVQHRAREIVASLER